MGERGAAQSAIETQDAALAARIDVQAHTVADLDRRLGQIDFRDRGSSSKAAIIYCRRTNPLGDLLPVRSRNFFQFLKKGALERHMRLAAN
jgi:hypothetical protein